MSRFGWFGWSVTDKRGIGHAFKEEGGTSLCGKVKYRRVYKHKAYRACLICSAAWSKEYPSHG